MTAGIEAVERTWGRFGSFINTLLIIFAAMTAIYAYGQKDEATARDIRANKESLDRLDSKMEGYLKEGLKRWEDHNNMHRDRLGDVKEREGSVTAKLASLEEKTLLAVRSADQVSYRVTVNEEAIKSLTSTFKETNTNLSQVIGDMQVIKAILTRMEKRQP